MNFYRNELQTQISQRYHNSWTLVSNFYWTDPSQGWQFLYGKALIISPIYTDTGENVNKALLEICKKRGILLKETPILWMLNHQSQEKRSSNTFFVWININLTSKVKSNRKLPKCCDIKLNRRGNHKKMQSRDTVIHSHTNQNSKSKILPEIQDLIDDDALTDFLALENDDFECERKSSRPTTTLNIRRQTITLTLEILILVSAF